MNAFSAAIDAIFADPNMAADALYRAQASVVQVPCRVSRAMPDQETEYGGATLISDSMRLDVRVSEVAAPKDGDLITLDGEVFVIHGQPRRDRLRLVWSLDVVPENA
jgi:hypothetical protein